MWAADFNEDANINVVDVVNLSMHIVGLAARSNTESEAYIQNDVLYFSGSVAGVEFSGGELVSDISGDDVFVSGNNKSIIYNLSGKLDTDSIQFEQLPDEIIVSDSNGELLDVSILSEFGLADAYPNPFNPSTNINFSIENGSYVSIKVYNMQGREVDSIADSFFESGNYALSWDASEFSSGVYIVKLIAGNLVDSNKIMLIK